MMNQTALVEQDRRGSAPTFQQHWNIMTAEQKMSFYRLQAWGYRLLFVRSMPRGPLAVIAQDQELAAITADGELDTNPQIVLRGQ
ncbi:DUF4224 domain-containing protein [Shewanella amazonensis]|uniref:Uncharacterized protein n=2 Tax=Shewanella amazonensis TaxID=60478 RepID=A1S2L0_SHEAM|nr:conserved hypothetical protein [Shewanella amazonensis SB2B]